MNTLPAPGAAVEADARGSAVPDVEARFRALVQSPLRAGLLRYLHTQPERWFDIRSLMAAFGCMHLDVSNCLVSLVDFGLVRRAEDGASAFSATWPTRSATAALLRGFLEERPEAAAVDRSPAARRFRETVARDEKMLVVLEWIRTAAKSDLPVLIVGPRGSDAPLAARMIHELGRHASEAFRMVRCTDVPEAPDGAGVFGLEALRGTLLLDGVGELSLPAQTQLLEALGAQATGVGSPPPFRLISTATRPLDEDVSRGRFREELYQAINGFAIRLPALAERPADVPALAERFLARCCADDGLPNGACTWAPAALARLQAHDWPGDVRELEQVVVRTARTARKPVLDASDLPLPAVSPAPPPDTGARLPTLREAEQVHIARVLNAVGWNKKEAARVLAISRGTLYRKIDEYGLRPPARGQAT